MIDLIHYQMTIAGLDRAGQARQLITGQDGPGRVGRRSDQGPHAVLIPVALHQIGSQLVAHLGADRHQLRRTLHQAQEMPVAGVARVRE